MVLSSRSATDILIIGGGIAGATAAYVLGRAGYSVLLLSKEGEKQESASNYAQGGIVYRGEDDTAEKLYQDIWRAGCGLNNEKALRYLCEKGPQLVQDFLIDTLETSFSRHADGRLDFTMEAAHRERRIIHSLDATGHSIISALYQKISRMENVTIATHMTAVDLITPSHHSLRIQCRYEEKQVVGCYVLDRSTNKVLTLFADTTILATGGIGQVYLHTTNPHCARGDGIVMAYRAGAELINCEYMQFHPTSFYHPDANSFLISEAVRGEGGRLMNLKHEYFMEKYSSLGDLAPRDIAARAIHNEMIKTGNEFVLLDTAGISENGKDIQSRFPGIYEKCLQFGVNISEEPIPIVPAAHYFCGGIKVDLQGRTGIKNLYAVGETACSGVHGANRLASTSLLECLLWGWSAAEAVAGEDAASYPYRDDIPDWVSVSDEEVDPALIHQDKLNIKTTMWNYVGIVRSRKRLNRAMKDLSYLRGRIEEFYRRADLCDELVGLRNLAQVALIVLQAAQRNRKSIGCHYREDGNIKD